MYKILIAAMALIFITSPCFAIPLPATKPDNLNSVAPVKNDTPLYKKSNFSKPLNNREINLYKEIFTLQKNKQWDKARALTQKIDNTILMPFVIAGQTGQPLQRQSSKIQGTMDDLRYFSKGSKYISDQYKNGERYELNLVKEEVSKYLDNGSVSAALSFFNKHRVQRYIDPIDKSQILAEIASHYLYLKRYDSARSTALKAIKASNQAPLAGWVMGLTAWMRGDMVEATKFFTLASDAPYASPWMTSAASYWGARAATRAKLFPEVSPLLAKAVKNQRTFYGLIATKALGYGYDFNWTMPSYKSRHKDILLSNPAGARAVALIEVEQLNMAEEELFTLSVKQNPKMAEAAIVFANHYNLAGYAMRFSSAISNPAGGYYDAGLFPISTWTDNIDNSDQAMLNAFIRQESRFRVAARNGTGATGLMQVMPNTAAFVTNDGIYKSDEGRALLSQPRNNVTIGGQYLNHLMDLGSVDKDLFGLAIAYNAGPGKLNRWKNDLEISDPLLFIELIPSSETRAFVERVLTNFWVYQMRMGTDPKTLTNVAQGDWPKLD